MNKLFTLRKTLWAIMILFIISCSSYDDRFDPKTSNLPNDFEVYYKQKLEESKASGAVPGCEEKFKSYGKQTEYAILYIHGWGACRQEGEEVVEALGDKYKYNTYYLRHPGHGTNKDDQYEQSYIRYIEESEKALEMMSRIGKKTILIGTSMGGLISTYLAAKYPDRIEALVLVSPFYDYSNKLAHILEYPGGIYLGWAMEGRLRISGKNLKRKPQPDTFKISDDYKKYWMTEQYLSSVPKVLAKVRNELSRNDIFTNVKVPVILFYWRTNSVDNQAEGINESFRVWAENGGKVIPPYDKSLGVSVLKYYWGVETWEDKSASVPAMFDAFEKFNTPQKKKVLIEDGSHVLFSKWLTTDKPKIRAELFTFIDETLANAKKNKELSKDPKSSDEGSPKPKKKG
jgi:pimeloyl-ACP methyl ester carboxylesterase